MGLSYIYTLLQTTASGQAEIVLSCTQKWKMTRFIQKEFIEVGWPLSSLDIARCKDGYPETVTYIDPWEFMEIDLGEE